MSHYFPEMELFHKAMHLTLGYIQFDFCIDDCDNNEYDDGRFYLHEAREFPIWRRVMILSQSISVSILLVAFFFGRWMIQSKCTASLDRFGENVTITMSNIRHLPKCIRNEVIWTWFIERWIWLLFCMWLQIKMPQNRMLISLSMNHFMYFNNICKHCLDFFSQRLSQQEDY